VRNAIRRIGTTLLLATAAMAAAAQPAPAQAGSPGAGPGGPVLVVAGSGNPFGRYYAEILRAEGLNEFAVVDKSALSAALLSSYQVVLLADSQVSAAQASALSGWVGAGGNLIAMRPGAQLAGLLGLGGDGGDLANGYVGVHPAMGVTSARMQYHGTADRWSVNGAVPVATLYAGAATAAAGPAVTLRAVGARGGQAAAFTYDLARSVVYTRQGNPAQVGDKFDPAAGGPLRSNDLFQPAWLDISKVRIPQADEQQRLLANLIIQMNLDRAPLPRFWYLPRGEKAAVVMTGDDHGSNGTADQFQGFENASPSGCSVADWQCVRATSYTFDRAVVPGAVGFQNNGFEIALHLSTNCNDETAAELADEWGRQLPAWKTAFPGIATPRTNRTHCVVWTDWVGEATAEREYGVRLDTNYYYFPGSWAYDNPGLFTGSGFPMRFADTNGALIDVYQAATQLTDEWESGYETTAIPAHINALINGALGPDGYYGVFTANMHTDVSNHAGANAIVAAALARGVPVVSAAQMLDWLDGRNGSSFQGVSFANERLRFSVLPGAKSRGLQAMLPAGAPSGPLTSLTRNGVAVPVSALRVKGIDYKVFSAAAGSYVATYGDGIVPGSTGTGTSPGSNVPAAARRVKLAPKRLRVSSKGKVRLRVKCPSVAGRCRVKLTLKSGGKVLAKRTFKVAGGKTRSIQLRLRRSALRKLVEEGALRATATAVSRDAAGARTVTRKKVRLLAPE
jgi:hypothetical protein